MVYNTGDYRVFGLCPLSGILKNMFQKLDLLPSSGERVEGIYSDGSVRKSYPLSLNNLCQYKCIYIYIYITYISNKVETYGEDWYDLTHSS
jgi:hypothetical protein